MSYVELSSQTGLSQTTVKYHVAMGLNDCLSVMGEVRIDAGEGGLRHIFRLGRSLPISEGCVSLASDELLPLRPGHKMSFDGRVFGPIKSSQVRYCASPFLTIDR